MKPSSALPVSTNWKVWADVVALHDLGLELVVDAERLHRLHGGCAIGRRLRVGDGDLGEVAALQRLLALHEVRVLAPEHELADRVGELASRNGEPLLHRLRGPLVVGREEDLEGGLLRDLGVQLAGRAEAQDRLVAGLLLEGLRDLVGGVGEVRRDRDVGLRGLCRRRCAERDRDTGQDMKDIPGQQPHRVPSLDHPPPALADNPRLARRTFPRATRASPALAVVGPRFEGVI